jgi:hypothetical protein
LGDGANVVYILLRVLDHWWHGTGMHIFCTCHGGVFFF